MLGAKKILNLVKYLLITVLFILGNQSRVISETIFEVKMREAQELYNKGELIESYIAYSVAYEYAANTEQRIEAKKNAAEILFKIGDLYAAEEIYKQIYKLSKDENILRKLIIIKAETLQNDFYDWMKTLSKEQVDSEILYYLGKYILRKEKNPKRACEVLDSVRRESQYFYKAQYLCGTAMIILGDLDEALRRFLNAEKSEDKLLKEYSKLAIGRIYSDVGRFKDALPYYLSINPDSPVFYEARYETCWIFYGLEMYSEVPPCIEYFKSARKTHLTKRIEILEAFHRLNEDLVGSLLTFTAISDSSSMLITQIAQTKKFSPSFWRRDSIKFFSAKEPHIAEWIEFFPEYKFFKERREYIIAVKKYIENIIADLQRIRLSSVLVADRSIKRYMERVWLVQEKIHGLITQIDFDIMSDQEKKLWFSISSIFLELKNMDIKSRELAAVASINMNEVWRNREFKNWEKKYKAYEDSVKYIMNEINNIENLYKKNFSIIKTITDSLKRKDGRKYIFSDKLVDELTKLYDESFNIFLDFSSIWNETIKQINAYLQVQEKELRKVKWMLDNFLDYLGSFEGELLRYLFITRLENELKTTYALAQYGFIESSWTIKARESEILDSIHMLRLEEENKVRDNLIKISDSIQKIGIGEVAGRGQSSFEEDLSTTENYMIEILTKINETEKIMREISRFSWTPPDRTIQQLIEEKKMKSEKGKRR